VSRRTFADRILHLYPRAWRDRYGDEVRDLMEEVTAKGEFSSTRLTFGLLCSALAQRVRSLRPSWRTVVFTGTVLAFIGAAIVVVDGAESGEMSGRSIGTTKSNTATVGPVPSSALKPGGSVDLSQVPDFVSALSNGKVVGYIPKSELFPTRPAPKSSGSGSPPSPYVAPTAADMAAQNAALVQTVYGPDLATVVGHMYPGAGFVPLGATPQQSSTVTTVTGYGMLPTGN